MRKYLVPLAAAAAVVVAPAAAQAAPSAAPHGVGIATETSPTDEGTDDAGNASDESEDSMDWGWLGLLGLIGLAGLLGRNRTQHVDTRRDTTTTARRDYDRDGDRDADREQGHDEREGVADREGGTGVAQQPQREEVTEHRHDVPVVEGAEGPDLARLVGDEADERDDGEGDERRRGAGFPACAVGLAVGRSPTGTGVVVGQRRSCFVLHATHRVARG